MAASEFDEALAVVSFREIGFKYVLQEGRQLIEWNAFKYFASNCLFISKAAAHHHMVAFDGIPALFDLGTEQTDIPHVVLSA